MAVPTPNQYWIRPDALTFSLNTPDVDYLRVSVLAGSAIIAYMEGVIDYDPSHNHRKWPIQAADTFLETTEPYYVHAQLTRSESTPTALIVYSLTKRSITGKIIEEDGTETGEEDQDYFYVYLGKISSSIDKNGQKVGRTWIEAYNPGKLDTNQGRAEDMDGHYLSKLFDDIAHGLINFEKGVRIKNLILKVENDVLSLTNIENGKRAHFAASGTVSSLGVGTTGGGGGSSEGGASALYQLLDVLSDGTKVEGAEDGSVLTYDENAGKWKATKMDIPEADLTEIEGQLVSIGQLIKALQGKDTEHSNAITALQQKDREIEAAIGSNTKGIESIQKQLDTLVSGDVSDAIDSFNEVVAFLKDIEDTDTLEGILAGKQNKITETNKLDYSLLANTPSLADFMGGSSIGGTASSDNFSAVYWDGKQWQTRTIYKWALASNKPSYTTSEVTEGTRLYFTDDRAKDALKKTTDALSDRIAKFEKMFQWGNGEDSYVKTPFSFASDKTVSSLGVGSDGGGGVSYNRLDSWDSYTDDKAGYVLSAALGWDLKTRLDNLDLGDFDLSGYLTKSEAQNTYATIGSLAGYLPLSGGTIDGSLTVKRNVYIPNIFFNGTETERVLVPYSAYNYDLSYYDGAAWNRIIHSGNIGSYALPLSGGTITSSIEQALTLHRTADNGSIGIKFSGAEKHAWVGFEPRADGHGAYMYTNGHYLWLASDGVAKLDSNTLIHSGNIGSQSVASAGILRSYVVFPFDVTNSTYRKFATITLSARYNGKVADLKLFTGRATADRGNSCDLHVMCYQQNPLGDSPQYSIETNNDDRHFKIYGVLNVTSSSSTLDLYAYGNNWSYYQLYVEQVSGDNIISIDSSNVSELPSGTVITPTKMGSVYSASKLTTPRTIWGQNFDGTGNVSGHLLLNGSNIRGYNNYSLIEAGSDVVHIGYGYAYHGLPVTLWGSPIRFAASGNYDMTISSNGNVLIGTTTDSGYKLYVEGNSYVNGNLNVAGRSAFSAAMTIESNLYVKGSYNLWEGASIYKADNNALVVAKYGVEYKTSTKGNTLQVISQGAVGVDWSTAIIAYGGEAYNVVGSGVGLSLGGYVKGSYTNAPIGRGVGIAAVSESTWYNVTGLAFYTNHGVSNDADQFTEKIRLTAYGSLIPKYNTSQELGNSDNRWSYVYSVNGDFSGSLTVANSVTIGDAKIWWDATNQVLRTDKSFASDKTVSSLGVGTESGGGGTGGYASLDNVSSDVLPSANNTFTIGNSSRLWKAVYANSLYIGTTNVGDSISSLQSGLSTANGNIGTLNTRVTNIEGGYAKKATTLAGYGITDALPLSGGTIESTSQVPLLLNSSHDGGTTRIAFINKNTPWGYLGFNGLNSPCFISAEGGKYPLIHSNNIGSQRVASAGYLNSLTSQDAINGISTMSSWNDWAKSSSDYFRYGLLLESPDSNYKMQLCHNLWNGFQIRGKESGTWGDWRTLAFTDSNVASSTRTRYIETKYTGSDNWYGDSYRAYIQWETNTVAKLKVDGYSTKVDYCNALSTARTIWGQSFDGSENVSGHIVLGNKGIYGENGKNALVLSDNAISLGYGYRTGNFDIYGGNTVFRAGETSEISMRINSNCNITLGASDWAGSTYKLYVNGNSYVNGQATINGDVAITANQHVQKVSGCVGIAMYAGLSSTAARIDVIGADGNWAANAIELGATGDVTMYHNATVKGWLVSTETIYAYKGLDVSKTIRGIADNDDEVWSIDNTGAAIVKNITVGSNERIQSGGNNFYIGNANNAGWVGMQDICSQNALGDSIWSIRTDGRASFGSTLKVTGATTLSSTLGVTGVATFNSNIKAKGYIYFGTNDDAYIYWDASKKVLRTNVSFASDKTVSSLGVGTDEGGGGGSADWGAVPTDILPISDDYYNIGSPSLRFSEGHFNNVYADAVEVGSCTIYSNGNASFGSLSIGGADAATQTWVNTRLASYISKEGGSVSGTLTAGTAIYTGEKTAAWDGKSGAAIMASGNLVLVGTNPHIYFGYGNATTSTSSLEAIDDGGFRIVYNMEVFTSTVNKKNHIQLNYGNTRIYRLNNDSSGMQFQYGTSASSVSTKGTFSTSGAYSSSSDITKKNILSYNAGFNVHNIAEAPIAYFTWKDLTDNRVNLGSIAQYWQLIAPECIYGTEGIDMTMDYSTLGLVSSIINARAIVSHENEIDKLKKRVEELESENKKLQERVDALVA